MFAGGSHRLHARCDGAAVGTGPHNLGKIMPTVFGETGPATGKMQLRASSRPDRVYARCCAARSFSHIAAARPGADGLREWTLVCARSRERARSVSYTVQGVSETEARALIADAGPLFADPPAALQRGETEKAFELADEGRARLLAVALKLQAIDLADDQRRRLERSASSHSLRSGGG